MLSTSNTNSGKSSYRTTTLAQDFRRVNDKQNSLQARVNEYGNLVRHQEQEIKSFKESCQEDNRAMSRQIEDMKNQIKNFEKQMQKLSDTQKNKK